VLTGGTVTVDGVAGMLPVLIRLFGGFRLIRSGQAIEMRRGGKTEALLSSLALHGQHGLAREALMCSLWPEADSTLAYQSLNSLLYNTGRLLSGDLQGAAPVLHRGGIYRLNFEAGVGVDIERFDALITRGDRLDREGASAEALSAYRQAVTLYEGDVVCATDSFAILERERLRARFMEVLAALANDALARGDFRVCLDHVRALLTTDPVREDGHRLAMQCYARRGQRAQALRQYRTCAELLAAEFDAEPEPATVILYEQIRQTPGSV
jgi:DNA-binding SARP family transcriptional activator